MRVLVVDDDARARLVLWHLLRRFGFAVRQVASAAEAVQFLTQSPQTVDVVLADYDMPGGNGLNLLRWCGAHLPHARLVLMTAHSIDQITEQVPNEITFFRKPMRFDRLIGYLNPALSNLAERAGRAASAEPDTSMFGKMSVHG